MGIMFCDKTYSQRSDSKHIFRILHRFFFRFFLVLVLFFLLSANTCNNGNMKGPRYGSIAFVSLAFSITANR